MDWNGIRAEFPVTEHWAYFDHAAVSPLGARARDALIEWAADMAQNGMANLSRWTSRMKEVRQTMGRLMNADPQDLAFVKNTSEGIGYIAGGFPWSAGDNVVTAAEEFPSNIFPWMNLESRGVELRLVPSRQGRIPSDNIFAMVDGRTRVVSISSVEFASGYRNDLDAIGEFCRGRGIFFMVDAIQSLGAFPFDVQRQPIDALSADGHKWLLGPEGAGIFYLSKDWLDRIRLVEVGWNSVQGSLDFANPVFQLKPHAGRWESGALNVAGIHVLGASVEWLLQAGISIISGRILELTDYLCEEAARAGLTVFSSRRDGEKSGIVSLIPANGNVQELVKRAKKEGIILNHRSGRLRVSPHCYNSSNEIDRLIGVIK